MKEYVFVVYTRAKEGREAEFNKWYDEIHIPDILNLPGFVSARRFQYVDVPTTDPSTHPYLALYTVKTDDIVAAQAALQAAANTPAMMLCDALDLETTQATYFESLDPSGDDSAPLRTARGSVEIVAR
jgi:hypothetical protein